MTFRKHGLRAAGYFLWLTVFVVSVRVYLVQDAPPPDTEPGAEVGVLIVVRGDVNLREPDGLFWRAGHEGVALYEGWTISTGSGATADVQLFDGRRLQIGEKSMLALNLKNAANENGFLVQVLKGGVRVQAAPAVATHKSSFGLASLLESKQLRRATGFLSHLGVDAATRALPHPVLVNAGNTTLRADAKSTDFALSLKVGDASPQVNVLQGLVEAVPGNNTAPASRHLDVTLPQADLREVVILTPGPMAPVEVVPALATPETVASKSGLSVTSAPPGSTLEASLRARPLVSLRPPRLASLHAGDVIWTDRPLQGNNAPTLIVGARLSENPHGSANDDTQEIVGGEQTARLQLWLGQGPSRGHFEAPDSRSSYAFSIPGNIIDRAAAPVNRGAHGLPERLLTLQVGALRAIAPGAHDMAETPVTSTETVVHLRSVRDLGARPVDALVPLGLLAHESRGARGSLRASASSDQLRVLVVPAASDASGTNGAAALDDVETAEHGFSEESRKGESKNKGGDEGARWLVALERGETLGRLAHALGRVPLFSIAEPEARTAAAETSRIWLAAGSGLIASVEGRKLSASAKASAPKSRAAAGDVKSQPGALRALARSLGATVAFEGRGRAFLCVAASCADHLRDERDLHYFATREMHGKIAGGDAGEAREADGLVAVRTRLLNAEPAARALALSQSIALFDDSVHPLRLRESQPDSFAQENSQENSNERLQDSPQENPQGEAQSQKPETPVPAAWSSEARADLARGKSTGTLRNTLIVLRSFTKKKIDPLTVPRDAAKDIDDSFIEILDATRVKQCFGFSEPPERLAKKQEYELVDIFEDLVLNCGARHLLIAPQGSGATWTLVTSSPDAARSDDRSAAPQVLTARRPKGLSKSEILSWLATLTSVDGVVVSERGQFLTVVTTTGSAPPTSQTEAVVFRMEDGKASGGKARSVTHILERVAASGPFTLYRRLFRQPRPGAGRDPGNTSGRPLPSGVQGFPVHFY